MLKLNRLIERNKGLWTNEQGEDEWALINHSWLRHMWYWAPAFCTWIVDMHLGLHFSGREQMGDPEPQPLQPELLSLRCFHQTGLWARVQIPGDNGMRQMEWIIAIDTNWFLSLDFLNGVTPGLGNYFLFGQCSTTCQLNLENILRWVMCILPVVNNINNTIASSTTKTSQMLVATNIGGVTIASHCSKQLIITHWILLIALWSRYYYNFILQMRKLSPRRLKLLVQTDRACKQQNWDLNTDNSVPCLPFWLPYFMASPRCVGTWREARGGKLCRVCLIWPGRE